MRIVTTHCVFFIHYLWIEDSSVCLATSIAVWMLSQRWVSCHNSSQKSSPMRRLRFEPESHLTLIVSSVIRRTVPSSPHLSFVQGSSDLMSLMRSPLFIGVRLPLGILLCVCRGTLVSKTGQVCLLCCYADTFGIRVRLVLR